VGKHPDKGLVLGDEQPYQRRCPELFDTAPKSLSLWRSQLRPEELLNGASLARKLLTLQHRSYRAPYASSWEFTEAPHVVPGRERRGKGSEWWWDSALPKMTDHTAVKPSVRELCWQ